MREKQLENLQKDTFDLLIIGGGATGSGIALDAATRGYRVALVEAEDFASGTSSRSTKLIHGGVRYLEDAIKHLNFKQFNLVREALHERTTLLKIAPHLTRLLPIFIPAYSLWQKWYYGIGMKLYEIMAGSHTLKHSHFISREESIKLFPNIKQDGLCGGIIYYDGQFDDARMNISIILTAISYGATIANYVSVVKLNKKDNVITSATVKDHFSGKEWEIKARIFVNATGPFVDEIRALDDPKLPPLIKGSAGSHILFDKYHCPQDTGLLIPKTADGRVLFLLPWEGSTLVGTTDMATKISHDPKPTEEEIDYIIHQLNQYLHVPVSKEEIRSTWSGIRPLVQESDVKETSRLSRDFKIVKSPSKLYSIAGGKWTSYRRMGSELIDTIIKNRDLPEKGESVTDHTLLVGGKKIDKFIVSDLDEEVINHLLHSYGDRAVEVIKIAEEGFSNRLAEGYPYIEAEVIYATRHEYVCTEMDVLSRRTRLYTLDQKAAEKAFKRVSELLNS